MILDEDKITQFILAVKDMREKQKTFYESRKKVGSNKHLLQAAIKAEMDVDGILWEIEEKGSLVNQSCEEPEMSLF